MPVYSCGQHPWHPVLSSILLRLYARSLTRLVPASILLLRMYSRLESLSATSVTILRIIWGMQANGFPLFPSTFIIFLIACTMCHALRWSLFLHNSLLSLVATFPLTYVILCRGKDLFSPASQKEWCYPASQEGYSLLDYKFLLSVGLILTLMSCTYCWSDFSGGSFSLWCLYRVWFVSQQTFFGLIFPFCSLWPILSSPFLIPGCDTSFTCQAAQICVPLKSVSL